MHACLRDGGNASSLGFKTDTQVEELSRYSSNGAGGLILLDNLDRCPSQGAEQTLSNGAGELLCWYIQTNAQVRELNRHSATEQVKFLYCKIQTKRH
jgi:hypothetical protein